MKKLLFLIALVALFSCKKSDTPTPSSPPVSNSSSSGDSVKVTFNFTMNRADTFAINEIFVERYWSSLYNSDDHIYGVLDNTWKVDTVKSGNTIISENYITPNSFSLVLGLRTGDSVNIDPGLYLSLSGNETMQIISSSGYNSPLYLIKSYVPLQWRYIIK